MSQKMENVLNTALLDPNFMRLIEDIKMQSNPKKVLDFSEIFENAIEIQAIIDPTNDYSNISREDILGVMEKRFSGITTNTSLDGYSGNVILLKEGNNLDGKDVINNNEVKNILKTYMETPEVKINKEKQLENIRNWVTKNVMVDGSFNEKQLSNNISSARQSFENLIRTNEHELINPEVLDNAIKEHCFKNNIDYDKNKDKIGEMIQKQFIKETYLELYNKIAETFPEQNIPIGPITKSIERGATSLGLDELFTPEEPRNVVNPNQYKNHNFANNKTIQNHQLKHDFSNQRLDLVDKELDIQIKESKTLDTLVKAKIGKIQGDVDKINDRVNIAKGNLSKEEATLADFKQQISHTTKDLERAQKKLDKLDKEFNKTSFPGVWLLRIAFSKKFRTQQMALGAEIDKSRAEVKDLKENLKIFTANIEPQTEIVNKCKNIEKEVSKELGGMTKLQTNYNTISEKSQVIEKNAEGMKKTLVDIDKIDEKLTSLNNQINEKRQSLKSYSTSSDEYKQITKELNDLSGFKHELNEELDGLNNDYDKLHLSTIAINREIKVAQSEINDVYKSNKAIDGAYQKSNVLKDTVDKTLEHTKAVFFEVFSKATGFIGLSTISDWSKDVSSGLKQESKEAYDRSREQAQESKEINKAIKKTANIDISR